MPTHRVPARKTPLVFSHPAIKNQLVVDTGANEITWSYNLNTSVIPTRGGEVVQILGCYVGPMTIIGQTTDNEQLRAIHQWFLKYMEYAGLHNRDQRAVHFRYAERDWEFWIQPTNITPYQIGRDLLATEWHLQAEVVDDNGLQTMIAETDQGMAQSLFDSSLWDIGFQDRDPKSDPLGFDAAAYTRTFSDNFQSLLGAWASGDFAHWGFDVLADPTQNKLNANSRDYWMQIFGTNFISGKKDNSSLGGPNTALGVTGNSKNAIILQVNGAFEAAGIPGKLGVAVVDVETGGSFNPGAHQIGGDYAIGLFQTFPSGAGGSQSHSNEVRAAWNAARPRGLNPDPLIPKNYPAVDQIDDAIHWFLPARRSDLVEWAQAAQGAGDLQYKTKIAAALGRAPDLIKSAEQAAGSTAGYKDPLRAIQSLGLGRIDQGCDYSGSGPIYAIGDGVISCAGQFGGWPGPGTFISYRLTNGAAKGMYVYIAENITPAKNWKVGEAVDNTTVLGTMHNAYPFIETGWAVTTGQDLAAAHDIGGARQTVYGTNFAQFLRSFGAAAPNPSDYPNPSGTLPANWPTWR